MQLSYSPRSIHAVEGEKTDSSPSNIISKLNGSETTIPSGRLVSFGPDGKSCVLAKTKEDVEKVPLGISLWEKGAEQNAPGKALSILRQGRVFVSLASDVVAPGDSVYVTLADGTFGGKKEAATALLKGACFMSAGTKGEIIEMEINLLGGVQ